MNDCEAQVGDEEEGEQATKDAGWDVEEGAFADTAIVMTVGIRGVPAFEPGIVREHL